MFSLDAEKLTLSSFLISATSIVSYKLGAFARLSESSNLNFFMSISTVNAISFSLSTEVTFTPSVAFI